VPGRGRLADDEALILQAHMDMVCEKDPGVEHDFTRDPLRLVVDGPWLRASGTTLGADNGIGLALALAAAEADLAERPPLELLFTVDEESGLTGAMQLAAAMLRGRQLVNLDSEKEGVFIVSCAGGRAVTVRFPRESTATSPSCPSLRFRLAGLRGGHSGVDINDKRTNAVVAAAGIVGRLRRRDKDRLLLSLSGGTQFNVIPRTAECVVAGVPEGEVRALVAEVRETLRAAESGVEISVSREEEARPGALPWAIVDFIAALPNGVIAMDGDIEGLVHTSSNLGVVTSDNRGATLLIKVRSASDSRRDEECEKIAALARRWGGEAVMGEGYPGWASSSGSELVQRLNANYRHLYGREADIRGIHAGLEAGVIGELIGSSDLVSLGPTIENAHSPGERLLIDSVGRVSTLLEAFLGSPRGRRNPRAGAT
jgi:dipeptidase D